MLTNIVPNDQWVNEMQPLTGIVTQRGIVVEQALQALIVISTQSSSIWG